MKRLLRVWHFFAGHPPEQVEVIDFVYTCHACGSTRRNRRVHW